MNIIVTSISNAEEESKRLNNAKIHPVYIKYQTNVSFFFSVGVPSKLFKYCHKEFHKSVLDPPLVN